MIGTRFYLFGGQVDGEFLNDLWSFDLNSRKCRRFASLLGIDLEWYRQWLKMNRIGSSVVQSMSHQIDGLAISVQRMASCFMFLEERTANIITMTRGVMTLALAPGMSCNALDLYRHHAKDILLPWWMM